MSNLTAVEWLIGNLNEKNLVSTTDENFREYIKVVTQAYEMFYKQIIEAHGTQHDYSNGSQRDPNIVTGEDYYKKTYGGEE
jgi:ABC-type lipopolysaccharide export system ATPase subunit